MTVDELLQAGAEGRLSDLLAERGHEVTPELAEEVRNVFRQATGSGDGNLAFLAAGVAAQVYLTLGDRYNALLNQIDFQQLAFMAANTLEEYSNVREGSAQLRTMASGTGAQDLAFRAAVLAADSSFFAIDAAPAAERDSLIVQTLRDVLEACAVADESQSVWFERLVSLLAASANAAMSVLMSDDEEREAKELLKKLAAEADRLVPVEFAYAGDPEKTSNTAAVLATLSDEYG